MFTSQTAKDLYKTLWVIAQVAFWMTVLAALYTRQASRWFRAYYQAEWADAVQSTLTYPDRCLDLSPALVGTADTSSEHSGEGPGEGDEALPENVASILNSDRSSTAKLRAIASLCNIPWRNARGHGKHMLNQDIKQALTAYPKLYQALCST